MISMAICGWLILLGYWLRAMKILTVNYDLFFRKIINRRAFLVIIKQVILVPTSSLICEYDVPHNDKHTWWTSIGKSFNHSYVHRTFIYNNYIENEFYSIFIRLIIYFFFLKINEECTKHSKYKAEMNEGTCDRDEM